jgi:hypothetical protein
MEVQHRLADQRVKATLSVKQQIERSYDIPYVACSALRPDRP